MESEPTATSGPIVPIVIGTAGHIDHGKSTLVRALTGIDPDRLEEEKQRGMTIDLGFAWLPLPGGRRVGIVDVPGHERFIRNMVAGASGIDLVVLVVAADDGVMPQTREHLAIMGLLGVRRGFVALTKIDLVDEEMALLAEEDVRETLAGSFLEGAPVQRVSATSGAGLEELRALLIAMAGEVEPRTADGVFRMPVQRVFSARGFGTVLTGIPVSGSVRKGELLEVLPGGQRGKVRGIQAYHEAAESARAGHSTALNLSDVEHHRVERGDVVATPGYFRPARMVGVELRALAGGRPISDRMAVRVHTGTSDAVGELVLLDCNELAPGASGLAQLRMQHPLVCAPGDRFVLRLASPMVTLGGGRILDESRHRLKRFKHYVIEELEQQRGSLGSPAALLEARLARARERWLALDELAVTAGRDARRTRALLEELEREGRVVRPGSAERWMHAELLERSLAELLAALDAWFAEHPLRQRMDVRELRRRFEVDGALLDVLLARARERGEVETHPGGLLARPGRGVELDPASAELRERLLAALRAGALQPPSLEELRERTGSDEGALRRILEHAVDGGEVVHVGGELYLDAAAHEAARAAIVENCQAHGHLEIPALRDRLGTSRKFLIPLLEHFDARGLTHRQGAHRVLRRT